MQSPYLRAYLLRRNVEIKMFEQISFRFTYAKK